MSFIDVVRYRLRVLLRPNKHARDIEAEYAHHLALEEMDARSTSHGAPSPKLDDEVRSQARRRFGNVTYSAEERRIVSGLALVDSAAQDCSFLLRILRRRAAFAIITITTIALGIGAATSIYSVADAVLFRSLPFPNADRLVTVWLTRPKWKTNPGLVSRWDRGTISLPMFRDWRASHESFEDVAIWKSGTALVGEPGGAEEVRIVRASASLPGVLGIRPQLGAWYSDSVDAIGGPPVAVMSHETWTAHFTNADDIVGRAVKIDGVLTTIVGVTPPGLTLDRTGSTPAYWLPSSQDAKASNDPTSFAYFALARLRPTASLAAATAESNRFFPAVSGDERVEGAIVNTLHADQTRNVRRPMLILLMASGLLLLIACINVATLLMGETAVRQHELRTRTALGASRSRLLRQLLTESLALAGAGAILGTVLATAATRTIVRLAPPSIPGVADVHVNTQVLVVTLVVAAVTGILCGLVPGISLMRSSQSLAADAGRHSSRGRERHQRTLIACEVALSMVLLVAAGLLVRSFDKLSSVGFAPDNLVVASVQLPTSPFADSIHARAVYDDILQRLKARPEVVAVAATTTPPFSNGSSSGSYQVEGRETPRGAPGLEAQRRATSANFFAAARIPIMAGRSYNESDRSDAPLVIVVSSALARTEWPGESAVGKRIKFGEQWRTVIGVAGDIETERPVTDAPETIYVPLSQMMLRGTPSIVIRTHDGTSISLADVRAVVRSVEAHASVSRLELMNDLLAVSFADDRLRTVLIGIFAFIAALLAAVGTYGVATTAADHHTREVAIRVAIGASNRSITRLIVGGAAQGVAIGAVAGIALALAGTRVLLPYLYGIKTTDPVVYAAVAAVLAITTVAATWIPARRALRVPVVEILTGS